MGGFQAYFKGGRSLKQTSPASDKRTGLDFETSNSNSSTKPTKPNTTQNGHKTLDRIARKWASRGYYPTPSAAMRALLGDQL